MDLLAQILILWCDGDGWKIKVVATGEITDEAGTHEIADNNVGKSLYNYVRVEETDEAEVPKTLIRE